MLFTIVTVLLVGGGIVFLFFAMSPKRCPACSTRMRLLDHDCGKTKKYHCPNCGKRVDTGIPIGRGR